MESSYGPIFLFNATPILAIPWSQLTPLHLGYSAQPRGRLNPHVALYRLDTRRLLAVLRPCISLSFLTYYG